MPDIYLVVGGSGLLGRHIAKQLQDRGDNVSVLDIVQRYDDVPFFHGDICEEGVVLSVLKRTGATCVIHTASPQAKTAGPTLFWKVNVDGTKLIITACIEAGVKKLVYTSSSGVVFDGSDLQNADENYPYAKKPLDVYMETKIQAEKAIIAANGVNDLSTVILRPSGIFGPGDRQLIAGLYNTYLTGRTNIQIGNNKNLTDWTPVVNVADAHILAADKLSNPYPSNRSEVAGQIFFITNDDPWFFWDFTNGIWNRLDAYFPGKRQPTKKRIIPRWLGMCLGAFFEFEAWLRGRKPSMTRFTITFSCAKRWHNISKAKKVLGYQPRLSISDEMDAVVKWWMSLDESERH
ncbi:NAD(P)-binding protein [Gymnopus androsaceus JB14]|uniref:NAD(P)-binding protein n=1 Tax=Gymnopus androsaceus JB14 TaxID=1447944 RepID=A0A6A4HIX0_9AGAR|nr:NAD(P)-binding protein [Gymnopus androsaceus JB14]KAE9397037.1 NAD(P)-binding protein [Gymnopus androsaceus JB14]